MSRMAPTSEMATPRMQSPMKRPRMNLTPTLLLSPRHPKLRPMQSQALENERPTEAAASISSSILALPGARPASRLSSVLPFGIVPEGLMPLLGPEADLRQQDDD